MSNEEAVNELSAPTSGAGISPGVCGKSQVTWRYVEVFIGKSGFLHHLQLVSHD